MKLRTNLENNLLGMMLSRSVVVATQLQVDVLSTKFRATPDEIFDALVELDRDGILQVWNAPGKRGALQVSGKSPIMGMPEAEIALAVASYRRAMNGGA